MDVGESAADGQQLFTAPLIYEGDFAEREYL